MNVLNAYKLLTLTAQEYRKEKDTVSREEIVKRLNEIKYLAAQKNLPRLSLRKEMVHLEHQLYGLLELDKALLSQKKRESAKVKSLKEQLANLRKRLAAVEDKDIQKKVDRLTHLLGECAARLQTKEDVAFQEVIASELQKREAEKKVAGRAAVIQGEKAASPATAEAMAGRISPPADITLLMPRVRRLEARILSLQQELALQKARGKETEELKLVEQHIQQLQEKVREFYRQHPQAETKRERETEKKPEEVKFPETGIPVETPRIKHVILFGSAEKKEGEGKQEAGSAGEDAEKEKSEMPEEEFPLPPPPKTR